MVSSMSAGWTCQECHKPQRGARHRTQTGRTICGPCQRTHEARVFGMMAGGSLADQMEAATAATGARAWIRRAMGKKD
ncbi:MAG: hypothetical protein ABIP45_04180 [Knoellia sp.]